MPSIFKLTNTDIEYSIKTHSRSKRINLKIDNQGNVSLTIPQRGSLKTAQKFAEDNKDWILNHIRKIKQSNLSRIDIAESKIPLLRVKARNIIRSRIDHYNNHYQFKFSRITIRDQKTRWGSCSSNKTLSFNFRLAMLPQELIDYVVVHELCHLKEMNHSRKFWNLVAQTLPHYPILRKQLRLHEGQLM